MEKGNSNSGAFSGMDIASITSELGMILGGSGDQPGTTKNETGKNDKPPETKLPGKDTGNKIQIPETEEERKQLAGETTKKEGEDTGGEDTNEKTRGEDAEITEDSPLYLHAATLQENGILPTLDLNSLKGKKQSEVIKLIFDAQKKHIDDGRNDYLNSLSPRQKEFLELIDKGIPPEQVEQQFRVEDAYGKVTDEALEKDEELQEQIIINDMQIKGLSDKKIEVFLKASKEDGKLLEESKESLASIKGYINKRKQDAIAEAEKVQKQADDREKELQTKIKTAIDSVDEILPGIKISAAEKTTLYDRMTKPADTVVVEGKKVPINMVNKVRNEDRVNFDLRLNYFIELGMFKKDFDLTKLAKKIKSSATSKFAESFREDVLPTGGIKSGKTQTKAGEKETIIFPTF